MRQVHLPLLALALALAGCMGGGDGGTSTDIGGNETTDDGMGTAYPAPINASEQVTGSADPGNLAPGGAPCATPSSKCYRYPFQMNATGQVDAKLSWNVPASDFDLYVFMEGQPHPDSPTVQNPPGTSENVKMTLEPGAYEVVVVAWGVAQDTFKLEATFGPADAASA
ncbi:MAG TPA: hypothetical protein VNX21_01910 [Candidatus Thermoplasmatota archaeon]|nr:hypothetical protein [Candidatus Thermoplasmatota archaeon]